MKTKWLKSATAAALCLSIGMTGRARVIADDLSVSQQKIYYAVFFKEAVSASVPEGTEPAGQDAPAENNNNVTDAQSTGENGQVEQSDAQSVTENGQSQQDDRTSQQTDDQQNSLDQSQAEQDSPQANANQENAKPAGVTLEKDRQNGVTYSVVLMKAAGEIPAKVQGVDGTEVEISSDVRTRILEGEVYLETYDNHLYCAEDNRMVNPVTGEEEATVNGFLPIELDNPADASAFAVEDAAAVEDEDSQAGAASENSNAAADGDAAVKASQEKAVSDGNSSEEQTSESSGDLKEQSDVDKDTSVNVTAENEKTAGNNVTTTGSAAVVNPETGSAAAANPTADQNADNAAESANKTANTENSHIDQEKPEAADNASKSEEEESAPAGDTVSESTKQQGNSESKEAAKTASASAKGAEVTSASAEAAKSDSGASASDLNSSASAAAAGNNSVSNAANNTENNGAASVAGNGVGNDTDSAEDNSTVNGEDYNAAKSDVDPAAGKAEQKVIVVEDTAAEETKDHNVPDDSNAVILERGHLSDAENPVQKGNQTRLTLDEAMETFMPTQRKAVIADTIVNIREEASDEAKTVGTLVTGGVAYVEYQNAEWVYLESGDIRGFAKKSDFLSDAVSKAYMSDMVQDKAGSRIGFAREGGGYSLPKAAATVDPSENAALFFRHPDTVTADSAQSSDTATDASENRAKTGNGQKGASASGETPRYTDTGILTSNVETTAKNSGQAQVNRNTQKNGQAQSSADALPQLLGSEGASSVRVGGIYTYERWDTNWNAGTRQRWLYENYENYDAEGFGRIGDRYVIACTTTFGNVGDMVDFVLENGTVIKAVIGDAKNQSDPGCTKWGHLNGKNVIEFIVDGRSWYTGHVNPGTSSCHPEWGGLAVVKAVNYGSLDA